MRGGGGGGGAVALETAVEEPPDRRLASTGSKAEEGKRTEARAVAPAAGGAASGGLQLFTDYPLWQDPYVTEATQYPCVIARTHSEERSEARLLAFLTSLFVPNHPRLTVFLADTGDGARSRRLKQIVERFNALLGRRDAVILSRWNRKTTRAQWPQVTAEDYGYLALDLTLDDVINAKRPDGGSAPVDCTFVTLTDSNNIYSLHYFPLLMKRLNEGADMVGVHWVSRYEWSDSATLDRRTARQIRERKECGPLRSGKQVEMWAADDFHTGCIDLGAVMLRTSMLRARGERLLLSRLASDPAGADISFIQADGSFFSRIYAAAPDKAAIIRRVLMVQQSQ